MKNASASKKVDFIMGAYDFIGLVERYPESLIVLKMIYGLDLRDVLYASAKRSGGYDDGEYRERCHYIKRSNVTNEMKTWFRTSKEWADYMATDILMYRVVFKSFDMTVNALGRAEVARQVDLLEGALSLVEERCAPTAIYPCSPEGVRRLENETTCIAHDWACAYRCIDTLDLSPFR